MSTLKQRFAELQAENPRISQADLARASGVKPPSVNAWFTGETKTMKIGPAAKVAPLYDVNPLWLATGEGYKKADKELLKIGSIALDLPSNKALAPVDIAQEATESIATTEGILAALSSRLEQLDTGKRTAAAALLSVLAQSPGDPALIAAFVALLQPQAFTWENRRAA